MKKSVTERFNGLHGASISRKDIRALIALAKKEEQHHIAKRLETVLANNPEDKSLTFKILNPAIEAVPEALLGGLDYEQDSDDVNAGLGKAVSPNEIYQMITDRMIQLIEQANTKYKKKWKGQFYGKGYLLPFNFVTKKMYRGVNRFLLAGFEPLENPFFLTFQQIEDKGGKLKKGSTGYKVVYFTKLYQYYDAAAKIDVASYDKAKFIAMLAERGLADIKAENFAIPILKYYNVFNGKDIEGIDFKLDSFKHGYIEKELPSTDANRLEIAEAIIKHYPQPQPPIKYGGDRAFYAPAGDYVQMPHLADFETVQDFYRTLFHELAHSTGHKSRLSRKFGTRFGNKDYAFEELIAEFAATFLSAEAGIIWHTNNNHAAYLKSWNSYLTHLKDDNRFLMRAATQAQKAADFILQHNSAGEAKYLADLKKAVKVKKSKAKPAQAKEKKKVSVTRPNKKEAITLDTFKAMALNSKSFDDFYSRVERIKNVPDNVAKEFKETYGQGKSTFTAAKAFYDKHVIEPILKRKREMRRPRRKGNQLTLFGAASKGLKAVATPQPEPIATEPEPLAMEIAAEQVAPAVPKACKPGSLAERRQQRQNEVIEYFVIDDPEIATFLGKIEKKKRESVVITLTGGQGSMKTRMAFRLMNTFAHNYSTGHASIEEHPESQIYYDKVDQYLDSAAQHNIENPEIDGFITLTRLIENNDVIVIDSFQKLQEMLKGFEVDKDLRKKYNGKLFIVIFQQTTDGKMRGGSKSQFDADIVLFTEKFPDYRENYVYPDKNRYNSIPTDELQFNIYSGRMVRTEQVQEPEQDEQQPAALNGPALLFKVI